MIPCKPRWAAACCCLPQIYDRTGAEIAESPRLKEQEWRRKQEEMKSCKEVRVRAGVVCGCVMDGM